MKVLLITVALFVAIGLAAVLLQNDSTGGAGSQDVYDRIAATTDCQRLQAEFDTAWENHEAAAFGSEQRDWSRGYMEAADDRMNELGCY